MSEKIDPLYLEIMSAYEDNVNTLNEMHENSQAVLGDPRNITEGVDFGAAIMEFIEKGEIRPVNALIDEIQELKNPGYKAWNVERDESGEVVGEFNISDIVEHTLEPALEGVADVIDEVTDVIDEAGLFYTYHLPKTIKDEGFYGALGRAKTNELTDHPWEEWAVNKYLQDWGMKNLSLGNAVDFYC